MEMSIAIPTYCRNAVLTESIEQLFHLTPKPLQVLILDQSLKHDQETEQKLTMWAEQNKIDWIRLTKPSVPEAMNYGLLKARFPLVLFLDDDIKPDVGLFKAHLAAHQGQKCAVVAGRVIQPWDEPKGVVYNGRQFSFNSLKPLFINEVMGGNFSVRRDIATQIGGFDENFVGVAYRFESEFSERIMKAGYAIYYEPSAVIQHLKALDGGIRSYGNHLRSIRPHYGVGEYYFILRSKRVSYKPFQFLSRLFRSIRTRHHLRYPWWIPITVFAELIAMGWACFLNARGPKLLSPANLRALTERTSR